MNEFILVDETIKKFGHDPRIIFRKYSEKMVVSSCPVCSEVMERKYRASLKECQKCHNGRIARNTAEKRAATYKKWLQTNPHPRLGKNISQNRLRRLSPLEMHASIIFRRLKGKVMEDSGL